MDRLHETAAARYADLDTDDPGKLIFIGCCSVELGS